LRIVEIKYKSDIKRFQHLT